MPERKTLERAAQDKREGKAPSTQAGEFVREEIEHVREGKHGARSAEQAIAIGLSKARRAGVDLPPPKKGAASKRTRRSAKRDYEAGRTTARRGTKTAAKSRKRPSTKRASAVKKALKREPRAAASKKALSKHARKVARERTASERSASARKAVRTKGPAKRSQAARKAAKTRARKRN
jgi:hypothetical protein